MPNLLTVDKQERKARPIARGVLDYFPRALAEVAHVSFVGNQQHNPGQEMFWNKPLSTDHADCIMRHLIERGTFDEDGLRHTAKAAWRALALLETELEAEDTKPVVTQWVVPMCDNRIGTARQQAQERGVDNPF